MGKIGSLLSEELQVSRFTLRAALKELSREGITKAVAQKGTQILVSDITKRSKGNISVGIMTPDRLTECPHAVESLVIRHEHGRRMALVNMLIALGNNNVTTLIR